MADADTGPETEGLDGRTHPGRSSSPRAGLVLADTSVWELAQKGNAAAEQALGELASAARLATCAIVAAEVMFGTPMPARNVAAARAQLAELTHLPSSVRSEARALEVMVTLAQRGKHRSCGVRDLLIAAIAEEQDAAIMHYDRDFDHIAEVTGQPAAWVVPRGSEPTSSRSRRGR